MLINGKTKYNAVYISTYMNFGDNHALFAQIISLTYINLL